MWEFSPSCLFIQIKNIYFTFLLPTDPQPVAFTLANNMTGFFITSSVMCGIAMCSPMPVLNCPSLSKAFKRIVSELFP